LQAPDRLARGETNEEDRWLLWQAVLVCV